MAATQLHKEPAISGIEGRWTYFDPSTLVMCLARLSIGLSLHQTCLVQKWDDREELIRCLESL